MFERVLTATDMFEACDAAVITALEITKQNQGKLFILHVMEPSYLNECGPLEHVKDFKTGKETAASQEYKEAVKEALNEKCAAALKPYGNYQIDIVYGRPYVEIRRWARKMGADLIVLGPHGGKVEEEGLTGEPLGNTVEGVIMNVTSPVMVVNRLMPKERLNFKKIMICIDFSKSCAYGFQFASTLARKYGSRLFLFHVLTAPERETIASQEKLRGFCKVPEGIEHEYSIWEGTLPYLEILKYAREKDVDLVVMGSRTREGGERAYIGSAVEQVSTECFCPVAVVTHPDALRID
jgi:nucleotide-binding universal stress UspA family protein